MNYETIDVRPIAGALGAEVSGVDLTKLGNQAFSEIHRAFLDHQILCFRDQPLDDDQLEELTLGFGPFGDTPFVEGMPNHPNIIEIRKDADEVGAVNFGGRWHSDFSFQEAPPSATFLSSRVTPPGRWRHDVRRRIQRLRRTLTRHEGNA
jgi:taurine dioxygenase